MSAGWTQTEAPFSVASDGKQQAETFAEVLLGKRIHEEAWVKRWMQLPLTARVVLAVSALAALLFLPYLGAVGLWDPWETHYGEVARMMVQRNDYVYPFWESAWFFSKPPMTMWLQALGMKMVGSLDAPGELGRYTEWGMRAPFALMSIAAVALLSLAVSRIVSLRAGLATGFVLATMPLYFLLTRQTVTDTPFVATLVCAMACALIGQLDETSKHRTAWWYAFYIFCGLSALAKGLLGVGLPAVILLLYALLAVIPWKMEALRAHLKWVWSRAFRKDVREGRQPMPVLWGQMFRMRLGTGVLVFAVVAVPWYLTLSLFDAVDDEGKGFFYRFFIHDHLNRLTAGVHTTTPGGTFIYFIEQGGYAIFPWVALLPGAFAAVSRLKLRSESRADHLALIAVLWVAFTFWLLGSSATKFHHYVFPILPGLAILIALFIDRLWQDGPAEHAVSLLFGLVLFVLVGKDLAEHPKNFTDLFVYNYDRLYPSDLVTKPIVLFASRPLWMGDLIATALLLVGAYLALDAFTAKEKSYSAQALAMLLVLAGASALTAVVLRGSMSALGLSGVALLVVGAFTVWQALRKGREERLGLWLLTAIYALAGGLLCWRGFRGPLGEDALLRAFMDPVNVKKGLGFAFALGGGLCVVAALRQTRSVLFGSFWLFTLLFAVWFNWYHWVSLSHHWTQRDLFWRYYRQRQPGEPIAAFMMNWRGETFYSRNTVEQFRGGDSAARMRNYAAQPGREWALVEHNRLSVLSNAVGAGKSVKVIDRDINNKFILVTID
ncbi:glycosyl transferase, family 39, putative [Stigmatella aurantiaca DW4/3-1]|uniref:Glycosyl transferase, family 39, putative n=1 Tax=Stigmatella aurantiaca (strain DW4/3-1) TaxID=378806 RepID=Q09BN8_STIAD|nr:glycosyl transferase, family 39, putative [Stigmatella aurantiaca DW4/3-1]